MNAIRIAVVALIPLYRPRKYAAVLESRMRGRSALALILVALTSLASAQTVEDSLVGIWFGKVNASGTVLRIVVKITRDAGKLKVILESPDQTPAGFPGAAPKISGQEVTIGVPAVGASFSGTLSKDGKTLTGFLSQGGNRPLTLAKVDAVPELRRPQTPKPPFPYQSEETTFASPGGPVLSGTITIPAGKGPFPAAILVSGSGPQDRDELLMGHRPFAVLADFLTRRGVAVLRYDDRGTAKSKGSFAAATVFEFADDAQAAVRKLAADPRFDAKRIGIIGHSEGGLIGPIVAAREPAVGFIVMMAGPGVTGEEIILLQAARIAKVSGTTEAEIRANTRISEHIYAALRAEGTEAERIAKVDALLSEVWRGIDPKNPARPTESAFLAIRKAQLLSPWFRAFLKYDPRPNLQKVTVPVLVLNGTTDLQVDAEQNVPEVVKALKAAGNKAVTVKRLRNLNHLFQKSKTGDPSEYSEIETTLDPSLLKAIGDWFNKVVLKPTK